MQEIYIISGSWILFEFANGTHPKWRTSSSLSSYPPALLGKNKTNYEELLTQFAVHGVLASEDRIAFGLATPVVSYKLVLVFKSTILETTGVCRYDHIQYFFDLIELVVNMQATLSKHNSRKSRSFPVLDSGNENHVQCLKENNTLCKPDNGWSFLLLFGMCWSRLSGHAQNSRSVWRRRKIYPSRSCMLPKQNKNSTAVVLWYTFCAQDTHIF